MTRGETTVRDFTTAISGYADALGDYQEEINRLNVYPVPDGDTGTNLRLTLEAACRELDGADDPCGAIVRGSLMGARGNSGVITSQLLRGLCEVVGKADRLDVATLAEGLRRASDLAYQAVTEPQEGTILTVSREAAEAAEAACDDGEDLVAAAHRVVEAARRSLARTPELLPVLEQAGVVDAGGRGYLLLLECLVHALDGSPLPAPDVPARSAAEASEGLVQAPPAGEEGSLEFAFEVQFLYEVSDTKADAYRDLLPDYGDCVLVVGGAGLYNVHVHTNDVGPVIERAYELGRPRQIEVTYLEGQVAERRHEAEVLAKMQSTEDEATELDPIGLVAVAAGEGLREIFASMGVRGIVPGGQTVNPSAEEILVGIRRAHAEQVIILPNNRNVIASARTAAGVAEDEGLAKRVDVVPTESPLQGFTAIVAFDREAPLDDNIQAMCAEGLATKHGEVAYAVRTTETPAGHVEEGQCLGLASGEVRVVAPDTNEAVGGVLEVMLDDDDSLVTLVYGADVDEWSAHELGKRIEERFDVEVEVHHGGQPHYPYLIGVE